MPRLADRAVRVTGGADRARVAALLARAFADDPAMRFILPDDAERERRLPRLFALLFDSAGPTGMRLITAGGEAATLWRAPGRVHVGRLEMLRRAAPLWRALRFRVAAEWTVPGGGPRFWSMLREPDATVTA